MWLFQKHLKIGLQTFILTLYHLHLILVFRPRLLWLVLPLNSLLMGPTLGRYLPQYHPPLPLQCLTMKNNFGRVKYSHLQSLNLAVHILLLPPLFLFQPHAKSRPRKGYIIILEHYFKLLKKIKYGSKLSKTYTLKFSSGGLQRRDLLF